MDVLRLSVRTHGPGLAVAVTGDGPRHDSASPVPDFDAADAARLRWLLEDLPRLASASARSAGVLAEAQLAHYGQRLFDAVRDPFEAALGHRALDDIALQIDDPQGLARHLPWELMHDGEQPLAHVLGALVRGTAAAPRSTAPRPPGPLRLLLVVARPAGRDDVAFRSVASRVLAAAQAPGSALEADVLRPATFAALRRRLLAAWKAGRPYDIVHFDGHGAQQPGADGTLRTVLVFEPDPLHADGCIDAATLAPLLNTAAVRLLVLNACHAAAEALPAAAAEAGESAATRTAMSQAEQVATAAGVEVVAMSHAVYVATAALVVQDLYAGLQQGWGVASAVSFARRRWRDGPVERSPALGFSMLRHFGSAAGTVRPAEWPEHARPAALGDRTPAHPALPAVFHGEAPLVAADDALLLIERALAGAPVVQFIGLRGAGKSTLLLELGRWLVASDFAEPQRVLHLDLSDVDDAAGAVEAITASPATLLLIDNAQRIEGDPLRALPAWPAADAQRWHATLGQAVAAGARVVVAATAPLALLGDAPQVRVPRLAAADLRTLAALQAAPGAGPLPEAAIRWAGGHPGVLALLAERERAGGFADPATTLVTLSDLGIGLLPIGADTMMDLIRPLMLVDLQSLFNTQASALLPWLLMQFRGTLPLTPMLWQLAEATGLKSLAAAAASGEVDALVDRLQRAGLACRDGEHRLQLHPMLPYLVPQPINSDALRQPGHWQMLRYAVAVYVRSIQVRHTGLPTSTAAADDDLADLLHAFTCSSDSGAIDHPAALVFARRLRERLLELDPTLWPPVFDKLVAAFAKTPPPPDDGLFNPNNVFRLLRMEEARRTGDEATAAALAREANEAAASLPGASVEPVDGRRGPDMTQVNRYDTLIKTGRLLLQKDPQAARSTFEQALEAAGSDDLRRAKVQLELTRLLRGSDPEAARGHGEAALATFVHFAKAGLAEHSDVAQTAMSLSNVYRSLAFATKPPDAALFGRGEALCQASLDHATSDGERATAWINLAGWRRDAGDPAVAAAHFLEAANLYEQLGNPRLLATALAYRAECLLDSGDALQARIDGVRATTLLVGLPDKPKELILFAYQTAERAMAQLKAEGWDDATPDDERP